MNKTSDQKLFGSNLFWEEENLEPSLHGGSDLLDPPQWDLDMKQPPASSNLELELSMGLAKKLLLANPAMGLESPQMETFHSSYPPPGSVATPMMQAKTSNHRFKTEICRNFKEKGTCLYGELCQFAHGKHELRKDVVRHNKYKTKLCQKYWITGYCAYGPRCNFIHDTDRRHVMTNQGGQTLGLRPAGSVQTAYYKTAAEVIAAVKKNNTVDSGDSSGSDDGGAFSQGTPFVFSNPYRDGGSLLGLEQFPTFYPRGYNQEEARKPCGPGPVGSGRPTSEKKNTMPGV